MNVSEGSGATAVLAMDFLTRSGGSRFSHATRADRDLKTHEFNLQTALNEQTHNHSLTLASANADHTKDVENNRHANSMEAESHTSGLAMSEGTAATRNQMKIARQSNVHEIAKMRHEPLGNFRDRTEGARQFDMTHALKEKAFERASDTLDALE